MYETNVHFSGTCHNIITNNCHDHVAMVLNKINYKGKSDWNQVDIFKMFLTKGKYFGIYECFLTYVGFVFIILLCIFFFSGLRSILWINIFRKKIIIFLIYILYNYLYFQSRLEVVNFS